MVAPSHIIDRWGVDTFPGKCQASTTREARSEWKQKVQARIRGRRRDGKEDVSPLLERCRDDDSRDCTPSSYTYSLFLQDASMRKESRSRKQSTAPHLPQQHSQSSYDRFMAVYASLSSYKKLYDELNSKLICIYEYAWSVLAVPQSGQDKAGYPAMKQNMGELTQGQKMENFDNVPRSQKYQPANVKPNNATTFFAGRCFDVCLWLTNSLLYSEWSVWPCSSCDRRCVRFGARYVPGGRDTKGHGGANVGLSR